MWPGHLRKGFTMTAGTADIGRIRQAVPEDLEALLSIEKLCSPVPWQRDSLLRDLTVHDAAIYWVAETCSGQLAGYVACWKVQMEADIVNMAVLPEWRRRGVATALLEHLLDQLAAAGVEQVFLDVRESNQAARALYRRCGFTVIGQRTAYYPNNGESAIIMTKKLDTMTNNMCK